MRNILLLLFCCTVTQFSIGQNADWFYRKGDSLSRVQDFKNSAIAYAEGIRMQGKNAEIRRYRTAAGYWALANVPDSAFYLLNSMAKSDKLFRADVQQIEYGTAFASLQNDKQWKPLLDNIGKQAEKNSYPQEEFIYGRKDGMGLTLVCMKPKVKSNGKGIIMIRSGNWVSSYNGIEITSNELEQYLAKGFTIFTVMHGSQPRYTIPEEISDLRRAVRYIRYNAAKFGIDPNHIGITGISSGAHLALMVATIDDKINTTALDPVDRMSSRVQAVAVLFPPTDLINWGQEGYRMVNAVNLLKANRVWGALDFKTWNEKYFMFDEVSDTAARVKIGREISPIYSVSSDDPPVFILHGDADPIVPLQQSQNIIARFKEAGVINNFIIKKGGRHSAPDMNPEWQQFADWFEKYLK
jgi:acetyl esterase/lipase